MELAIDTSYDLTSIALSQQGKIISERTWYSGQNHTVDLAPNLIQQFEQAKIKLDSMEAVFVAKGPGSFNGLRVGISF
ncbi:MAG: tRNA (adenosine(37)-N6)-threonylcarbamoyltransferase complex dimerization subunit type 1 TsaB, partial [Chloroflexota bacterium]|nr:tRNA (adenosine(37)-N6)-threonylcarbamoyltransferase complex dimerization subunit type 1 TsaB [Chloroflexota bacterium]